MLHIIKVIQFSQDDKPQTFKFITIVSKKDKRERVYIVEMMLKV